MLQALYLNGTVIGPKGESKKSFDKLANPIFQIGPFSDLVTGIIDGWRFYCQRSGSSKRCNVSTLRRFHVGSFHRQPIPEEQRELLESDLGESMDDLFQPFLELSELVILDGALATELERRGANLNDPLWSAKILLETPDLIREVHFDYLQAGADVVTTASYQATYEGFARLGLSEDQSTELLQLSIRLAIEAREQFLEGKRKHGPLIAASVGSYGAFLADGSEYRGDYGLTVRQLREFHRKRVDALLKASPDLLAFETVPCRLEGEAIVELMEEFPEARAWLSFSCRDEEHVSGGELFRDCVELVNESEQLIAVGVNCTHPGLVESLISRAKGTTDKYLIAYPNSGEGWNHNRRRWEGRKGGFDLGELARRWFDAGARLIGGCCRTTPEDIRCICQEFRR